MRVPVALLVLSLSVPTTAQRGGPSPAALTSDISSLSDEFDDKSLDSKWAWFHERYGWPDKRKVFNVGESNAGALRLEPYHGAWVRDLNAPFLFQSVQGDFDVRARLRVHGSSAASPGGTWSLGGLMARVPNGLDSKSWEPRRENWHFVTTGVGLARGKAVTETKGTYNSYSSLKLRPFQPGWVELRLVRVGVTLFALARSEGDKEWQLRDRFYRMEFNPNMQVGLIAYTTSDEVPPAREDPVKENREVIRDAKVDMQMDVDWIRFSRPQPKIDAFWEAQVQAHPLADTSLSDAQILKALGA